MGLGLVSGLMSPVCVGVCGLEAETASSLATAVAILTTGPRLRRCLIPADLLESPAATAPSEMTSVVITISAESMRVDTCP